MTHHAFHAYTPRASTLRIPHDIDVNTNTSDNSQIPKPHSSRHSLPAALRTQSMESRSLPTNIAFSSSTSEGNKILVNQTPSTTLSRQLPISEAGESDVASQTFTCTAATESSSSSIPNVLIFGETGTGKSSLINMLAESTDMNETGPQTSSQPNTQTQLDQQHTPPVAQVSSDALGCTFKSIPYHVCIDGKEMTLWDTAGLNEGEHGSVPAGRAMQNLLELVRKITSPSNSSNVEGRESDHKARGISLLVYCMRGTRFRDIVKINYDLFYRIICKSKVPIVAVITGLENESPAMESWWIENSHDFAVRGMSFAGHACVTTTKGKKLSASRSFSSDQGDQRRPIYMFEEEYEESQRAARALIKKHCGSEPWVADDATWVGNIASQIRKYYELEQREATGNAVRYGPSTSAGGEALQSGPFDHRNHARRSNRSRTEEVHDSSPPPGGTRGSGLVPWQYLLHLLDALEHWVGRQLAMGTRK